MCHFVPSTCAQHVFHPVSCKPQHVPDHAPQWALAKNTLAWGGAPRKRGEAHGRAHAGNAVIHMGGDSRKER
eukprot:7249444-Alexandrium_andersonii.AAC.1